MAFRLTLAGEELSAPGGAIIGLVGEDPEQFELVLVPAGEAGDLVVRQSFLSPLKRIRLVREIESRRRAGDAVVIASSDPELMNMCDELWWIESGELRHKGHPAEVLPAWQRDGLDRFRQVAGDDSSIPPLFRRGDGRARLLSIEPCDSAGQPSAAWQTGEMASVSVRVRFEAAVEDPVVGIMIRTHLGMEVYGTNTQLEGARLGPVNAGDERTVRFEFLCRLCPQMYVVTAASHDPDGVWHDWVEDAVAVTVGANRYTAGVVNLEARVSVNPF